LCAANLEEADGLPEEAAKWDAEAASLLEEYNALERSIA
jgi:hypothetical protein